MTEQEAKAGIDALERLVAIAKSDTGQSRRVANFLLAWWNASDQGGFDLTDLWNVDRAIASDMIAVFTLLAQYRHYPDALGLELDFHQIIKQWRGPRRRTKLQRVRR